ncbi:MAG: hypothetical protein IKF52_00655 [Clostridia bacterium]|nr:hypothetical protein [Clostridia bacterium]
MFIFNFKLNGKKYFKIFFVISVLLMITLLVYSSYRIFTNIKKEDEVFTLNDEIPSKDYPEIKSSDYTNVLKEVHDNINEYVGKKMSFVGYVYRIDGFKDNQFVLARNMVINNNSECVVVGFLSEYENSKKLEDNQWIKVYATIKKGDFSCSEIPILDIDYIEEAEIPDEPFVPIPNNTYVPTSVIY